MNVGLDRCDRVLSKCRNVLLNYNLRQGLRFSPFPYPMLFCKFPKKNTETKVDIIVATVKQEELGKSFSLSVQRFLADIVAYIYNSSNYTAG